MGMFGNPSALRSVAGNVGDALLRLTGSQPVYQPAVQRQQAMAWQQQMQDRKRDQDWQDFQRQYQYQLANPKPVNNDTVADFNFISQTLGQDAGKDFLRNKANPPVYRVGPDGQFYRVDVAQQPPETLPADFDFGGPITNQQGGAALGAASRAQTISQADAARVRASLGPNGQAAFENWLRQNNIVIGN